MTAAETSQIITSIAALIAACGSMSALILGFINRSGIQQVKKATDGMKDELVKVTGEKNFAEGVKHGEDHPREGADPVKVEIVSKIPRP